MWVGHSQLDTNSNYKESNNRKCSNHFNSNVDKSLQLILSTASIAMKDNIEWAFYISYYIMAPHMQLLFSILIATTHKVDISKHIYPAKESVYTGSVWVWLCSKGLNIFSWLL